MEKSEIIILTIFVLIFVLLSGMSPVFAEDFEEYGVIINHISLDKEITASSLESVIILFRSFRAWEEAAKALPEIIQYLIDEGHTILNIE